MYKQSQQMNIVYIVPMAMLYSPVSSDII